ncbi:MAG: ABC transporter permease [Catalinimonas sp.]
MLRNYLKVALRNLRNHRQYALISTLGLALGVMCALLIFLLIAHHRSFDAWHAAADRIYRVVSVEQQADGTDDRNPGVPYPMAALLPDAFPQMEEVVPVFGTEAFFTTVGAQPQRLLERNVFFTTPALFRTFDYEVLRGDVSTLAQPGHVVLTIDLAERLFPDQDPLGQTLRFDEQFDLRVGAVVADPPVTTQLRFTALLSYEDLDGYLPPDELTWGTLSSGAQVFVKLREGAAAADVDARFPAFNRKHRADSEDKGNELQALADIHFDPRYSDFGSTIPPTLLATLGLAGLFLVLLACVNFVNLATAQAVQRGREVGIRKVLGSRREQLVGQFLIETAVIVAAALLLAVGGAQLLLPRFQTFVQEEFLISLVQPEMLAGLLALFVVVTLAAGLYPALLLSGFRPARVLKGRGDATKIGGMSVRQVLVGFQFVAAQVLLVSTLVVGAQTRFLREADMGFEREAILTLPLYTQEPARLSTVRQQLLSLPEVEEVSFSNIAPASNSGWYANFGFPDQPDADFPAHLFMVDDRYAATYGLKMVAGRMLQPADSTREFVINETMAHRLGFDTPAEALGAPLRIGGGGAPFPIVGVVGDFHTKSLHEAIDPILLYVAPEDYYRISVRLARNTALGPALERIEATWTAAFPGYIYHYEFIDDAVAEFYELEQKLTQLFMILAGVALLIGCLGLYGLVTFVVTRRTKEIGVRKVLGASPASVVVLVSREFGRIALVSFVLAVPPAWYFLREWLQGFAYQIDLHPGYFVVGGALMVAVAMPAVSYQSLRAALINPVRALRSE